MATRNEFELSVSERRRRQFSDKFKKDKVRKIERGELKIHEIRKMYNVSNTSIYRWIDKFGTEKKPERLMVESDSDAKALLRLKGKLAEMERLLGQKQIEIEFFKKMIDVAEEHYGISIKKNFSTKPSDPSGGKGKSTPSA